MLIFGLVIYLTAKIVKWVGHLFFGSKFMDRRFPRLMQALKYARFLGTLGYTVSALVAINLYSIFVPEQGALLAGFMSRAVGIYVVACFMMLFVSALNVLDHLYGGTPMYRFAGYSR